MKREKGDHAGHVGSIVPEPAENFSLSQLRQELKGKSTNPVGHANAHPVFF